MARPKLEKGLKREAFPLSLSPEKVNQLMKLKATKGKNRSRSVELAIDRLIESEKTFNELLKPKQ
jgi:hypothetical protein